MSMPIHSDALTTVDNLKEVLEISETDLTKDDRLARLINRATAYIESKTERKLKCRNYNGGSGTHDDTAVPDADYIYFSGSLKDEGGDTVKDERGYGLFYLPAYPVQPDSDLTFALDTLDKRDALGDTWDTSDLVEGDDYIVDRENGILRSLWGRFVIGHKNYRITCAAGYNEGSEPPYVPADVEDLCILVAKRMYIENRSLQSESIGGWSRTFDTKLAESDIEERISLLRRWSL
jgi:hypothetical protein